MAQVKKVASRKRKEIKKIDKGQVHIQSTFNNTIVTVTDMAGNAISQSSAGALGYRVAERVRLSQHRWQLKRQLKLQKNTALERLRFM